MTKSDDRKAREHVFFEQYMGALTQIIGIRNSAGALTGYRNGYTKGKIETLAREYAKKAAKNPKPSAMVKVLRESLQSDPQLGKAFCEGWPRDKAEQQPARYLFPWNDPANGGK